MTPDRIQEKVDETLDELLHRVGGAELVIGDLVEQQRKTAEVLVEQSVDIETLKKKDAQDRKPPFSWLTATDPVESVKALVKLELFMDSILAHYPGGVLADCWRRHPHVVEELIVLNAARTDCWGPGGQAGHRFDWHNRLLPETLKRVHQALKGCSLRAEIHNNSGAHVEPKQVGQDSFGDFMEAWLDSHGRLMPPRPRQDALAESEQRKFDTEARTWGPDEDRL